MPPDLTSKIENFLLNHGWLEGSLSIRPLAEGDYNQNFLIQTPRNKYVLRLGSERTSPENRLEYEFAVLKFLESTALAPRPFNKLEESPELSRPVMLMSYMTGDPIVPERDFLKIPAVMARIHGLKPPAFLIRQENAVEAMLQESLRLIHLYPSHPRHKERLRLIRRLELLGPVSELWPKWFPDDEAVLVNADVGLKHFLVEGGKIAWVDWERAVVTNRYVDIAGFFCPYRTREVGDFVFSWEQKRAFLESYREKAGLAEDVEEMLEKADLMEKVYRLFNLAWVFKTWYELTQGQRADSGGLLSRSAFLLDQLEQFLDE